MILGLVLLILFEAIADVYAKEYSLQGNIRLALFAIVAYIICNSFWLYALRSGIGLAKGAVIFSIASAILACIIGLYFYGETLHTTNIIGLVIGIVAIVLLSI